MTNSGGGRGSRMAMSEINVTPFVDVMLVLLIVFMVTAPMMQQGIEVDLPETTSSGVETTDEPFIMVIKRNGEIEFGSAKVEMRDVRTRLSAIFANRDNKAIYIQADRRTHYGVVAEAMAEIRAAGIYNISLITLPK